METNQVILSKKNCHRASVVRQIAHPEYGDWHWEWRGQPLNKGFFGCTSWAHIAGSGSNSIVVGDNELHLWEVVSWKYEVSLEHLWDAAYRAFCGTSHTPEDRADYYIRGYEEDLINDLKQIPEDEQERYIAKFTDWVRTLFDKHSRVMSTMITGAANFPTSRNDKMNRYYDSAVNDFLAWREKALKAIAKRVEDSKPQEQKDDEAWKALKRDIGSSALTIIEINNGTNKYSYKPLFVSSIYGKVERIAKHGDVALVEKAIAFIRELNEKSTVITERHKFFKLADVARAVQQQQTTKSETESENIQFDGGVIHFNNSVDRLQIIFDKKPDSEMIGKLKHSGFRWSPRFSAWQRQLTSNAKCSASRLLGVEL